MSMEQVIPHVHNPRFMYPLVSPATVRRMIDGEFQEVGNNFYIIDCRYDYEYDGGHIDGAFHACHWCDVLDLLFSNPTIDSNTVLIFHCELSAQRGPKMWRRARDYDRETNIASFPKLFYPNSFVMEGGYRRFFIENSGVHCSPHGYVERDDPAFKSKKIAATFKRRACGESSRMGNRPFRTLFDSQEASSAASSHADLDDVLLSPMPRALRFQPKPMSLMSSYEDFLECSPRSRPQSARNLARDFFEPDLDTSPTRTPPMYDFQLEDTDCEITDAESESSYEEEDVVRPLFFST